MSAKERLAVLVTLAVLLWPPAPVEAGDAMAAALHQVKAMATRPLPGVSPLPQPREEWVPERRVLVPGTREFATVPGHWEQRISPTQSSVPTLTIFGNGERPTLVIPRGDRPPADVRSVP